MYKGAVQDRYNKQHSATTSFSLKIQFSQYSNSLVMVLNSGPKRISEEEDTYHLATHLDVSRFSACQ